MGPDGRCNELAALGRSLQQDLAPVLNGEDWRSPGAAWDDLPALDQVAADWAVIDMITADLAALHTWLTTRLLGMGSLESGVSGNSPSSYSPRQPNHSSPPFTESPDSADFTYSPLALIEQTLPTDQRTPSYHSTVVGWAPPTDQEIPISQVSNDLEPIGWAPPTHEETPIPQLPRQSGDRNQPHKPDLPQPLAWASDEYAQTQGELGTLGISIEQDLPRVSVDQSTHVSAVVDDAHPTEMDTDNTSAYKTSSDRPRFMAPVVGGLTELAVRLTDGDGVGANYNEPSPSGRAKPPQIFQTDQRQISETMAADPPAATTPVVGSLADLATQLTHPKPQPHPKPQQAKPNQNASLQAPVYRGQAAKAATSPEVREVREASLLADPPTPASSHAPFPDSAYNATTLGESARGPEVTTAQGSSPPANWLVSSSPTSSVAWPEARSPDDLDLDDIMDAIAHTITRDYRRFYGP
jgi:hypothetical protein